MNAQQLKNAILQEAIEGRLVPQDPNDEPASVLLNRIREEKQQLVKEGKLKKKDLEVKPISEDEIPFEIPESWEWVRLGEISTYANTKKKINAAQADSNLWGLDLEDIEKGGRLLCLKSVGERKAIGDKTCFSEGDILYSKLRPYLLKILIAPRDGICTPEIIPFTCYGCICKEFIVSLLKSAYVDDYINSVTFGVKMPRVSTETMVSLVIPLPPLAEQKRIATKIEELLPKVEEYGKAQDALNKLNDELPERLKKSILQEAIEGRLVPKDPNDEPASVLLAKIRKQKEQLVKEGKLKKKDLVETPISEDEIPFEIPESWEWVKLGSVISLLSGRDLAPQDYNESNNGVPYITGASNFEDGALFINRWTDKPITISNKGDLLITCKGTIGTMAYNNVGEIHIARQVMAINSLFLNLDYIKYFLMRQVYELEKKAKSIIPGISREDVLDSSFPLPPLAEQHRIVEKLEKLLGEIDKLKK